MRVDEIIPFKDLRDLIKDCLGMYSTKLARCFRYHLLNGVKFEDITPSLILHDSIIDGVPAFDKDYETQNWHRYISANSLIFDKPKDTLIPGFVAEYYAWLDSNQKEKEFKEKYLEAKRKSIRKKLSDVELISDAEFNEKNLTDAITSYLTQKEISHKIHKIAEFYPEQKSLVIDFDHLENFNIKIADSLLRDADSIIGLFEDVLDKIKGPTIIPNAKFNVRFTNLPSKQLIKNLGSEDLGKLISIKGIIQQVGDLLPKVFNGKFICNRCGHEMFVKQLKAKKTLTHPNVCDSCNRRNFQFVPEESEFIDVRFITIQETLDKIEAGESAREVQVWLEDDLARSFDVANGVTGCEVTVNGVYRLLQSKEKGSVYNRFIEANNVLFHTGMQDHELTNEDIKEIKKLSKGDIFGKITNSVGIDLYGHNELKLAIGLQLFSGNTKNLLTNSGKRKKGEINLLIVGDPGTAKTDLLLDAVSISPKAMYTTGTGSTGVGLTASVEKDRVNDGHWVAKIGPVGMCSGGVCAIDEFDKMSDEDRKKLHDAIENGFIDINKASVRARFNTQTAILAACNPNLSRFTPYKPLFEQIGLDAAMISRFDLIFPVRDVLDKEADKHKAEHFLSSTDNDRKPEINKILFRKYITYAKTNIHPTIKDQDAKDRCIEYYIALRALGHEGSFSATMRQLGGIERIAFASARARLSNKIEVGDVDRAIGLINFILKELATDETGAIDIDRIMTNHPKTERDKIYKIENIVRVVCEAREDKLAPLDDIMEKAAESKIDKNTTLKILNVLKIKGILFEPKEDKWKWVG